MDKESVLDKDIFDLIVIGSGPGGYVGAIKAAKQGMKVAIIEARDIGGTCLNRGCVPTKTIMHSSSAYSNAKGYEQIGVNFSEVSYDIKKIHERKDAVVDQLKQGVEGLLKANKVEIIKGVATILKDSILKSRAVIITNHKEKRLVKANNILIATGSTPASLPIEGANLPHVINSDELLSMSDKVYKKLIIIGGGVIGVEFASIYQDLGAEVVILEAAGRILPLMDKEISQSIAMSLKKKGVKIYTSAMVGKIDEKSGLNCHFTHKGKEMVEETEGVLVAVGRKANTNSLFDEGLSLCMDRDKIKVDDRFETNIPGIFAVGDVIGGMQLAHLASAQAIVAVEYMNNLEASIDLNTVPSCIYTSPEVATVGMTEEEAKEAGIEVEVGKFPMLSNSKTLISMDGRGYIKAIFDAKSGKVIGAQILCARATDMIGEFSTAIVNGLTKEELSAVIRPHPTYAESITEVVDVNGEGIHVMPRRSR